MAKGGSGGEECPDGGYGWVVAFCGMGFIALQTSYFAVFGAVYIELVEYYNTTKTAISWIGAVQQCMFGISGLVYGPLFRRYGARRVGVITPFMVATGYIATAFSSEMWTVFVAYAFLAGVGLGGFGTLGISSVYPWFSKHQPMAMAIVMSGIPLGAFIWPPLVTVLIEEYAWKGAFIIVAGIQLQGLVLFSLLKAPENQLTEKRIIVPAVSIEGLDIETEDNTLEEEREDQEKKSQLKRLSSHDQTSVKQSKPHMFEWLAMFKDTAFPICFFGLFLLNFGHIVPYSYSTARGRLLGFSDTSSALLASIVGAGSGVGRLVAGFMGNRLGSPRRMYTCAATMAIAGLASVISFFSNTYLYLGIYSAAWGFLSGVYAVYSWSGLVDLFGRTYTAEMTGFYLTVAGMAFLFTNLLTGELLDIYGLPSLPFVVVGGLQVAAAVCIFYSTFLKVRETREREALEDLAIETKMAPLDRRHSCDV